MQCNVIICVYILLCVIIKSTSKCYSVKKFNCQGWHSTLIAEKVQPSLSTRRIVQPWLLPVNGNVWKSEAIDIEE